MFYLEYLKGMIKKGKGSPLIGMQKWLYIL